MVQAAQRRPPDGGGRAAAPRPSLGTAVQGSGPGCRATCATHPGSAAAGVAGVAQRRPRRAAGGWCRRRGRPRPPQRALGVLRTAAPCCRAPAGRLLLQPPGRPPPAPSWPARGQPPPAAAAPASLSRHAMRPRSGPRPRLARPALPGPGAASCSLRRVSSAGAAAGAWARRQHQRRPECTQRWGKHVMRAVGLPAVGPRTQIGQGGPGPAGRPGSRRTRVTASPPAPHNPCPRGCRPTPRPAAHPTPHAQQTPARPLRPPPDQPRPPAWRWRPGAGTSRRWWTWMKPVASARWVRGRARERDRPPLPPLTRPRGRAGQHHRAAQGQAG